VRHVRLQSGAGQRRHGPQILGAAPGAGEGDEADPGARDQPAEGDDRDE
jgi:hypothetical protein